MIYQEGNTTLDIVCCKNCDMEILRSESNLCEDCTLNNKIMEKIYWFFSTQCIPCTKCGQYIEKSEVGHKNYKNIYCGECE